MSKRRAMGYALLAFGVIWGSLDMLGVCHAPYFLTASSPVWIFCFGAFLSRK